MVSEQSRIVGATGLTYEVTSLDLGATLHFEVIPIAKTGTPKIGSPASSAVTGIVVKGHAPEAQSVNIYGCPQVGETLTGTYWYVDKDGDLGGRNSLPMVSGRRPWGRYPGAIDDATQQTYTVTAEDEGAILAFSVTPVALTGTPATGEEKVAATPPIAAKKGSAPMAQDVSISGYMQVGETLTGTYNYQDTDGDLEAGSTFQWFRRHGSDADEAVEGATQQTYLLTSVDLGATLQFAVIPRAQTGMPNVGAERISAPTEVVENGNPPEARRVY